ncbi:MAG: DEAD/DEAH box helicase family protein [Thermaerobacter sp.]|jgi:type III restriction enzyme|nr:DEAD/DEAH box helicase family protein [Thermaerobacter sp.]
MSRIAAVDAPIINLPFEEPQFHWHIEAGRPPEKRPGRRLASYFFRVPDHAARGRTTKKGQVVLFEDTSKGEEYLLDLANLIRKRRAEWQANGYSGATKTTRELLDLWRSPDRTQRLFFAQLEAVETVLFLVEATPDLHQGIVVPTDEPGEDAKAAGHQAFLRYALKMATGTGKTTVMGMLAAWSILNKVVDPRAKQYSDTVLIVCPNITIRDRLRELDPNLDEASLYRTRELVPAHRMADLRRGEVIITNWHHLARQELTDVNGVSAKVVKRGVPVTRMVARNVNGVKETIAETHYYESDAAFLRRLMGNRKGRASAILVMNDEAHHAYRRGAEDPDYVVDDETAESDAREATIWIEGLDRLNKVLGGRGRGIRLCLDLSATPFYIQGSGNEVGKPFPWVVSDFSLLEAIESGLVKIPQLPTQDISGAETPAYFNVWRWVQERAKQDGQTGKLQPADILRYATQPIMQLADEWRKTAEAWDAQFRAGRRRYAVPPVFIIVCRDTTLAKELYEWLANGKSDYGVSPEFFRNAPGREWTIRIDSKVGEDIAAGGTKDETRRLRFALETIGKAAWPAQRIPEDYVALVEKHNHKVHEDDESGLMPIDPHIPPGRDIRCIISVAMLSEGWDATTVTHVVGLRPFGSQLLCEQVVGRALRRTSYTVDEATGVFREETAKVFGVPFELIPFKVVGVTTPPPTPPANQIYADPNKVDYEITFPMVEGYTDPGIVRITVNWARVPTLTLDPMEVPDHTLLRGLTTSDGLLSAYGPGLAHIVSLEDWRQRIRSQQVAFTLAKVLTEHWRKDHGDTIPIHRLFPQLLTASAYFLRTKLDCKGNRAPQDVALNPYFGRAVGFLEDALEAIDDGGRPQERPMIAPGASGLRSTRFVDFYTGKALSPVQHCHLNAAVFDTKTWEQAAAYTLDTHRNVDRWVKNDRLGFVVPYRKDGLLHRYFPDFLAVCTNGVHLIIEIKGQLRDAEIKAAAAQRWCTAVNNDGRFGVWAYHLVRHPGDMVPLLEAQAACLSGDEASKQRAT